MVFPESYTCIITCGNDDDRVYQDEQTFDDLIGVSRYMLLYKPKNGYEIRHIMVYKDNLLL